MLPNRRIHNVGIVYTFISQLVNTHTNLLGTWNRHMGSGLNIWDIECELINILCEIFNHF